MDDLIERQLQTAYELIKAGHPDQAREILIPLVRANPDLADGWFLLGHAVSDPQEKIRAFQQVLRFDPTNEAAQKQLSRLLATKKKNSGLLWGLAGLAGLIICLAGLGLLWRISQPLLASPAPTVSGGAISSVPTALEVVATATAKPSPTPRPTSRPTITMFPTPTVLPSLTTIPTGTATLFPSKTPTSTSTPNPHGFTGCLIPNGVGALAAPFKIENFGPVKATITIKGTSFNGNYTLFCRKIVKQGLPVTLTLMWGNYEYTVIRGSTIRTGSLLINTSTKTTLRIFEDKIQIGEFP